MSEPYIRKQPNDLIRAADWNQIQIDARDDIAQHQHTGGADGTLLGTASLQDDAVTAAKIADGAVGFAHLATEVRSAIQDAGLEPELIPNAVNTVHIANGAVTNNKIAGVAVTTDKLGDASVTSAKLAGSAVTFDKIASGAVTAEKIAGGAVTAEKIAGGAVTAEKLAIGGVRPEHILGGAVQTGHLAPNAVTGDKLAGAAVRAENLASQVVHTAHIVNGAITGDKLAGAAVRAENLASQVIHTAHIVNGAITGDKLAPDVTVNLRPAPGTIGTAELASGAVTGDKLAGGAVRVEGLSPEVMELIQTGNRSQLGFDFTTADWSCSYAQNSASLATSYSITGFAATLEQLYTRVVNLAGQNNNRPPFLVALRILTDYLEPDFIRIQGASNAYYVLVDSRLQTALARMDLLNNTVLQKAFEIIDFAYGSEHTAVALSIARLANVDAIYQTQYYSNSHGYDLVNRMENFYSGSTDRPAGLHIEVLAGLARPIMDPNGNPLPSITLPAISSNEDAVMEVEAAVMLRHQNDQSVIGIGTQDHPPLEFYASNQYYSSYEVKTVTLRRRMRYRGGLGIPRTARLWGVVHETGSNNMRILNMRLTARTILGAEQASSRSSLEAMSLPVVWNSSDRRTTDQPASTTESASTTEPASQPTESAES